MKHTARFLGLPKAWARWYQQSFKNKVLLSVLTIFVCIYSITLQLVYMQTANNLLRATQKEAISTTGILAMALYRSYEVDNDQREIQSFIVGSQLYRDNALEIHVLDRALTVIASTNENAVGQARHMPRLKLALNNEHSLKMDTSATPAYIRVSYPISAGLASKGNGQNVAVGAIENTIDISEQVATLANIRLLTILAGGIILLALGFALSRISSALTRPIEQLFQGMLKVNDDNLNVQVAITSQDEIGFLTGTFNNMIKSLNQSRAKLELMIESSTRFVPSQFLEMLGKNNITDVALGDARFANITVLFMDIRDFTRLSSNMSAQDVLSFLNTLNTYLLPSIEKHHGFIDKYIGDAIMAIFPKHCDHGLYAAMEMLEGLSLYNQHLQKRALPSIQFGIGINCGEAIVGTVGNAQRMDTTVIGDTVNIASRMEGLSKELNFPVIISEHFYQRLSESCKTRFNIQSLGQANIKGVDTPMQVYGVKL